MRVIWKKFVEKKSLKPVSQSTREWAPYKGTPRQASRIPKPRNHIEDDEQTRFFNWLKLRHPFYWARTHATPNGGRRDAREGARLKLQGVKPGIPDICVAYPRAPFHGLWIELKRPKVFGKPNPVMTAAQKLKLEQLNDDGYLAVVCFGFDEAVEVFENYIGANKLM